MRWLKRSVVKNLARGKVLLDCGATDSVGNVEALDTTINRAQQIFGTDPDWVSLDTSDWHVHKYGDVQWTQAVPKARVEVQPERQVAHIYVHGQETERVTVLLSAVRVCAVGNRCNPT